jgi:uncharacterized protein YegL
MADNLTQVLSNYVVYVDESSFMHGNMEFFKISMYNVLKSTNRKIKVVDFVVKELKKKQFSDSEKYAVKALKIIDFYRQKGLVEDVVTTRSEYGRILDVIYNNRDVDNNDVVVITENKELASEIVTNLSARNGIDFNHKIAAVRLINGPALWNIKTVKPRVMPINEQQVPVAGERKEEVKVEPKPYQVPPQETPTYEEKKEEVKQEPIKEVKVEEIKQEEFKPVNEHSRVKRNKLVVSLIVDNSSSLNEERAGKMKASLDVFFKNLQNSDIYSDLDIAIYGFDGFSPRVMKGYDGDFDISRFDNGGIQVLGKTIETAMEDLVERQKLYKSHNIETHKPWLVILTDGGAYGDITEQVNKLKGVLRNKKVTYFPFCLNTMEVDDSLLPLQKLKMFLKVREDKFTELFTFLFNTITQRINTPENVPMHLDRDAIGGFIAR